MQNKNILPNESFVSNNNPIQDVSTPKNNVLSKNISTSPIAKLDKSTSTEGGTNHQECINRTRCLTCINNSAANINNNNKNKMFSKSLDKYSFRRSLTFDEFLGSEPNLKTSKTINKVPRGTNEHLTKNTDVSVPKYRSEGSVCGRKQSFNILNEQKCCTIPCSNICQITARNRSSKSNSILVNNETEAKPNSMQNNISKSMFDKPEDSLRGRIDFLKASEAGKVNKALGDNRLSELEVTKGHCKNNEVLSSGTDYRVERIRSSVVSGLGDEAVDEKSVVGDSFKKLVRIFIIYFICRVSIFLCNCLCYTNSGKIDSICSLKSNDSKCRLQRTKKLHKNSML